MIYKEYVNYINRIFDTNLSIFKIYEELIDAKQNNNLEKYYTYKEYLELAITAENNIYEELNLQDEEEIELFLNILYFQVENKNVDENIKDKIIKRIENYFIYNTYFNPSISKKSNKDKRNEENINKILNQANYDYTVNIINEFTKNIEKEDNCYIRNQLINSLYNTVSSNKYLENRLVKKLPLKAEGKKTLLKRKHDYTLVNDIYQEFVINTLNIIINELILTSDESLTNNQTKCTQTLHIITLKSCLKIANSNTLEEIISIFYNEFLKSEIGKKYQITSSDSINKITRSFDEVCEEKYLNQKVNKK